MNQVVRILVMFLAMAFFSTVAMAQNVHEYVVKKTVSSIEIDGQLSEQDWDAAAITESFVYYKDGSSQEFLTQGKMLWDDSYLYIALICDDPDVWATFENHDSSLFKEEVAEIFIDPDGDGLNYLEIEVSPKAVVMDLVMSKEYSKSGKADLGWNMDGFNAAVWVDGTLNDKTDTDVMWVLECAIPFEEVAFSAPSLNYPPKNDDAWRLNLYRYEYGGANRDDTELSAWNQTDSRGFHAPDKFGRIIFSTEPVLMMTSADGAAVIPDVVAIDGNYPNPFNMTTTIGYHVPRSGTISLDVYNVVGQHVRSLVTGFSAEGHHTAAWNGTDTSGSVVTSGLYIARLRAGSQTVTHSILLMK